MDAERLSDSRVRLVLSRRELDLIDSSLLNALPGPTEDDPKFCSRVRVSSPEAGSLKDELWINRHEFFGPPRHQSESDRRLYLEVMPKEPRETGTLWDELPKMEAELLPDGQISYTLARGELSIFAGAIDAVLEYLAPDKSRGSRTEVWFRIGGAEIEELQALRDDLRRLDRETRVERSG